MTQRAEKRFRTIEWGLFGAYKESTDWGLSLVLIIIMILTSPFYLSFDITWLRGWPVVIYHLMFVGMFAGLAYGTWNPEGRETGNAFTYLVRVPLILIDFPVSLAVVALWFAISRGVNSQKHIVATIPTFLFGTIGTYWWYVMPYDFSFLS